ncbi:MAG: aspartate carbamoyltransferase regulatory subunit [Thermoprotei archaeon]|nr:aspartate carbamoyltransferase regulatory subunit [Thermoprotei archaeon]
MRRDERLLVSKIQDGTVIDHIPAGNALYVLKILGITGREGLRVAVVMNVESKKLGKKDIVKIEKLELKKDDVNKISLIAPTATINIIRNYKVVSKSKVSVPERIEGLFSCINPRCITNQPREPLKSKFRLVSLSPLKMQCEYCGYIMSHDEILRQLTGG